jgi:aminoglycoside-2''-adenylyltransferase
MPDGGTWPYPAAGFAGRGTVAGREVHCLTPEVQVLTHAGYELDADDIRDLQALRGASEWSCRPRPLRRP